MKPYQKLEHNSKEVIVKRKGHFSDVIYTFDIEVTSLFNINGEWRPFDYDIKDYTDIEHAAVPYIWMFGIDDVVMYGRNFMDFSQVLKDISDPNIRKYIFIHNLSYEMQWLLNIIEAEGWTIEHMISRDIRKPIAFLIPELNIEFRCTYMLTNMSLAMAASVYTDIHKKTGDLDYNAAYSPLSELDDKSLGYCEYDILCTYKIVKVFMEKYGHVYNIPYTQTGEVRRELRSIVDFWYIRRMQSLVPEAKKQLIATSCFSGGYTHSNFKRTGVVQHNCSGQDLASAHPSQFFKKHPMEQFRWCPIWQYGEDFDNFAYIVKVEFEDVYSIYNNTYLQASKMMKKNLKDAVYDNGRLRSCKGTFEMWLTDLDFELIKECYHGAYEILECFKAYKDYMDPRILKYVLKLYQDKTTLKGQKLTPELEARYRSCKININTLYGCCCTNILKQSSDFRSGQWIRKSFSPEFIEEKLEESKHSMSTIMAYTSGVWISAYTRTSLFRTAIKLDSDVIYMDTDSIKYVGKHDDIFNAFNKEVDLVHQEVCKAIPDISMEDFSPIDAKGNRHTIGYFECENDGDIEEFLTLGAKKYCYRSCGELHMTLSGVAKSGVVALNNDINNFQKGLIFDYKTSGKLMHYYLDEMPKFSFVDVQGHTYESDLKYGIVLAPTTYTLGLTSEYETMLNLIQIKEAEDYGDSLDNR